MTPEPPASPLPVQGRLSPELTRLVHRHLQFGWWSLLLFLTLGLTLEALHGFKASIYLNVSNETRRLMWILAHAHGTLLALVNIAFAVTLPLVSTWTAAVRTVAAACLMAASVLLPGGFFLGGLFLYQADPGLGIVLVPIGAVLLFMAVLLTARALSGKKTIEDRTAVSASAERKGTPAKAKVPKY